MFEYEKWKQSINPDTWLNAIKSGIKNKYNIEMPKFCFDDMFLNDAEFETWKIKYIKPPLYWVKYKHIKKDIFELKPFNPFPSDEISMKIIDVFLNKLIKEKQAKYFCVNKYYYSLNPETKECNYIYKSGGTYYTLQEARTELRSLLRKGYSKIELINETEIENICETAYHLHVKQDSVENMLKSHFLELEYF